MKNKSCEGCGGTGQTGFFAGESRFVITWDECPDCCGTGVIIASKNDTTEKKDTPEPTNEPSEESPN